MRIHPYHKARALDDTTSIDGLLPGGTTVVGSAAATEGLAFDTSATNAVSGTGVPLVQSSTIVLTSSPTSLPTTSSSSLPPSDSAGVESAKSSGGSQIPIGVVIGACVGAFVGLFLLICLFLAWYKRSSDKLTSSQRRNAAGHADQQRAYAKSFKPLDESEKARGDLPPPSPNAQEQEESDEKNFSMFKKSPSIRTAYTTKTTTDEFDLPQLEFTKYHPTLAQELSLENPQKPFATAAAAARQNSGVSWDGETLGDDSFLSMRSVRVDSGTMSPTMVMAKMTPPATSSAPHKWESAEVLNTEEASATGPSVSRNPFADMTEERKARSNNPFFNAQDMNRTSRAVRSRSNSRTSRTSRAQSLVRSESRGTITVNTNPFLDLHEAVPVSAIAPLDALMPNAGLPTKPAVASGASLDAFGNERAMASLIAALDLTKEQVEERLRVVSMQGSTYSAYSENDDDALTVREFPLPPGTNASNTP
ncbi:hypothetical protein L226DRAFT_58480 [Lentinus tigrinus ALCF2SS1-7]|uniref:Uncharacterized protein n=1 Tax=Lentinus tigrinus ALCF2SS1-6 TaxID=1328759 RepID=A0A5C2SD16_9APHY|nr:hypothetical protein L227DRAFT_78104 [Lentinus tigrinus ALCF2SS1-6]RPD75239.1 hypothetical protein L226DRAFT_58480 [Lentinus tigrinus ALCF2SS1-7]